MSAVKKAKPALYTVPALENLASRLSAGGDGEFSYYDKAPPETKTQTAIYSVWLATVAEPFGWMLFWAKYLDHNQSRSHFLAWAEKEIKRSGADEKHIQDLVMFTGKAYFEGRDTSARRMEKKLKICKKRTAPRYIETIDRLLYAAAMSEQKLGKQVQKMNN